MSDLDVFVRALMRELIYLHNQDGINMLTPQDIVWELNKAVAWAHDLVEATPPAKDAQHK